MKKFLSLSLGLIFIGNYYLSAQNFTAVASGNWSNVATWGVPSYPGFAAGTLTVTIPTGFAVTLDVSPAFPIGALAIAVGNGNNTLTVSAGQTLNVTGGIVITGAITGGGGVTKSLIMNGAGAVVNAASLTLTPGNADDKQANVVFNGGGTINITGNVTASAAAPIRTQINFNGGGTLSVGGDIIGGQISVIGASATSTLNISGLASTVGNLIMNSGGSTLDLNGNLSVAGTLTLTAGKIDVGPNLLTLSNAVPATQLTGGNTTSYVYATSAGGRLVRQNLAAATNYTFPVGTATDYLPVIVNTAAGTSSFAIMAYSPAASNASVGGPAFSASILLRIVNAMWFVDRPVGTGTSTLTLQWVDALEGATFAALGNASIGISRFDGTSASWTVPIQTSANAAGNTVTANFTVFGVFGVADIGAVLPAKFGAIKAYEKQNGIQLDWKVYSEDKVMSYEIERSADGRSYTPVGSLAALHTGDGDYDFFDANPLPGISYYRIKNNDLDGRSSYSIVMKVNRNKAIRGLSLYPNPVLNGIVTLQGSDLSRGNYKISIFGSTGQEIYRQQIQHNGGTISQTIELPSTMSKGINMFLVKDENGNIIYKEKLVNQ